MQTAILRSNSCIIIDLVGVFVSVLMSSFCFADDQASIFTNSAGMRFVLLPFPDSTDGADVGILQTEVTEGQFRDFVEKSGYKRTLLHLSPKTSKLGTELSKPVVNVTIFDAIAYAEWLSTSDESYSLPTVFEWEWACKCGDGLELPITDGFSDCGSGKPNRWGLYDMLGNVREICDSWASESNKPSTVIEDLPISVRGGSWRSRIDALTPSYKDWIFAKTCNDETGFRLMIRVKKKK